MVIQYNIKVTIINLTDNSTECYNKTFSSEITAENDSLLYNNHHTIVKSANILNMFETEIDAYCSSHDIQKESVDIDEFEITSLTDRVDVYFESYGDNSIQLSPIIKAYVYPKNDALKVPVLTGTVYDENTIIWAWPEDEAYAHYLVEIPEDNGSSPYNVIATIPIGMTSYAESGLEPDTPYTRRLINYTAEQTSAPSEAVTLQTKQVMPRIESEEYNTARNYDFTSVDSERKPDDEKYDAFHSGIGHGNDLKVYKQMDTGVPQKFKPLFKISGRRIQRERRYDQIGFKYKLCLEATEEIEEQEGEVTFDVTAYPRQTVRLREYIWDTKPVTVYSRFSCDVFLRKRTDTTETQEVPQYKPRFRHESTSHIEYKPGKPGYWDVEPSKEWVEEPADEAWQITPAVYKIKGGKPDAKDVRILFVLDVTASLRDYAVGKFVDTLDNGFVSQLSTFLSTANDGDNSLWMQWKATEDIQKEWVMETFGYFDISKNSGIGDKVHNNLVDKNGNIGVGNNMGAIRYVRRQILDIIGKAREIIQSQTSASTIATKVQALENKIKNKKFKKNHKNVMVDVYDEEGEFVEKKSLYDIIMENKEADEAIFEISNKDDYLSYAPDNDITVKYGFVYYGRYYYIPYLGWLDSKDEVKDYVLSWNKYGQKKGEDGKMTKEMLETSFPAIAGHDFSPTGSTSDGSSATGDLTRATDWGAGLAGAKAFMDNVSHSNCRTYLVFFSDGFPNTVNGSQKFTESTYKVTQSNQHKLNKESAYGDNRYVEVSSGNLRTPDKDTIAADIKNRLSALDEMFDFRIMLTASFDSYMFTTNKSGDPITFESAKSPSSGYPKSYIDYMCGHGSLDLFEGNTLIEKYKDKVAHTIGSPRTEIDEDDDDLTESEINNFYAYYWDREQPISAAIEDALKKSMELKLSTKLISRASVRHTFGEPKGYWKETEGEGWHDPVDPEPYSVYDGEVMRFDGWDYITPSTIVKYDIDDYTWVHITHDFEPFVITEALTPTVYISEEKRAIIPANNIMQPIPLDGKSIWEIIWPKIQETDAYKNGGYIYTIGTVEASEAEEDTFLVSGLTIEDSFSIGDNRVYNPNDITYQSGWNGSVNVYTDVDKLGTENEYGDDIYVVKKGTLAEGANPIYIQGYTEAIIHDGVRYYDVELNAFDNPRNIIISTSDNPAAYTVMRNRMNKHLRMEMSESTLLRRNIDVISRDTDIKFESVGPYTAQALQTTNHCLVPPDDFVSLSASISTKYRSPVLNYRFNLEDPDSLTPLYEILPSTNTNNKYKHVVILHIYYARNVYITDTDHYVSEYGTTSLITSAAPFLYAPDGTSGGDDHQIQEGFCKWSTKETETGNADNTWLIDQYLWFSAKPMRKVQKYYDELPKFGMDPFYGLVNGRYSAQNKTGMRDLRQQVSSFNIPTTVTDKYADTVKIYVLIQEYVPSDSIVSYKWDHPYNDMDSITQVNGDFITFHSDSISYKDEEYIDIIETIDMPSEKIEGGETKEVLYTLTQPASDHDYVEYFFEATTDNSDVMPMRYPGTIAFDNESTEIGITYKNVINSTSKWSPRIHNGYYYLNQHEYYAYSEFDVEADFEEASLKDYREIEGNVAIDVYLRRTAPPSETYQINKATRAELIQDELRFEWIDGKGLTVAKSLDGKYYQEYYTAQYVSPPLTFKNHITQAQQLKVNMSYGDNDDYTLPMYIRYYDLNEGKWTDWSSFTNGTVPPVLAFAYQVRFTMSPAVTITDLFLDDYLCCYLDWKDDMDEEHTVNIATYGDYMTTAEYESEGVFISKLLDNGCVSRINLSIFESQYTNLIKVYIATSDDSTKRLDEGYIDWQEVTNLPDTYIRGRYWKYKIVIPFAEKLYWLRKRIQTKQTTAVMPYIRSITMGGVYAPQDTTASFIDTESFAIKADTNEYVAVQNILSSISSDVFLRGFNLNEIERIRIRSLGSGVSFTYDSRVLNSYPLEYLSTSINAKTDVEDFEVKMVNTPFIFPERDSTNNEVIVIHGTPQQFSPITVENMYGVPMVQLFDGSDISLTRNKITSGAMSFMKIEEQITLKEATKFYELKRNDYEEGTIKVYVNGTYRNSITYKVVNHLIIFNDMLSEGDFLRIEYMVENSFVAVIDRDEDITYIYPYMNRNSYMLNSIGGQRIKYKVFFETNKDTNKFVADKLSLNPVYRTDYEGFIYLTDEHNEPDLIRIFCDPLRLKAGGYDKTDVSIEVVDIHDNPVINKRVEVDCLYGILTIDSAVTDINGVIHLIYESSFTTSVDTLTARTLKDDGTVVSASIEIISE